MTEEIQSFIDTAEAGEETTVTVAVEGADAKTFRIVRES